MTEITEADEHLMEFMKVQVRERKAVIGSTAPSERKAGTTQTDAFTMLVEANEDEAGKLKLDDEELVRWTFLQPFFFLETLLSLRCRLAMSSLCCSLVMVTNRPSFLPELLFIMIGCDRNDCQLSCCYSWISCVKQRCTGRNFSAYNFSRWI
jgi:hypothetical protein